MQDVLFRKNKFSSFVCFWFGTYYALFLECFDLQVLPEIPYSEYWVLAKIWAWNSLHKICNKCFIHHCQGRNEDSSLCVKLFDFFPNWILIYLTSNLSHFVLNSVETLT